MRVAWGLLLFFSASVWAYDCEDMLKKFEDCDPDSSFIEFYTIACNKGGELDAADLNSIYKLLEAELDNNACLAKIYKPPRFNRKARSEFRKAQRFERRQRLEEQRAARRQKEKEAVKAPNKVTEQEK